MPAKMLNFVTHVRSLLKHQSAPAWVQNILVIIGFAFIILQIFSSENLSSLDRSTSFVEKLYSGSPSVFTEVGELALIQYGIVKKVKLASNSTKLRDILSSASVPLVEHFENSDAETQHSILRIAHFFDTVSNCVLASACEEQTIVGNFGRTMLTFYNSVCPYLESLSKKWSVEPYMQDSVRFLYFNANKTDENLFFCTSQLEKLKNLSFFDRIRYSF